MNSDIRKPTAEQIQRDVAAYEHVHRYQIQMTKPKFEQYDKLMGGVKVFEQVEYVYILCPQCSDLKVKVGRPEQK